MAKFKKLYPHENGDMEFVKKKKNNGWTNIEILLLDHSNAIIKTSMFVNNKVKELMVEVNATYSSKNHGYILPLDKLETL